MSTESTETISTESDYDLSISILERVIEDLDEHGWCRRQSVDAAGRRCLAGSLGVVMTPEENHRFFWSSSTCVIDPWHALGQVIHTATGQSSVVNFNDVLARDYDEVRRTLEQTIEYVRERRPA